MNRSTVNRPTVNRPTVNRTAMNRAALNRTRPVINILPQEIRDRDNDSYLIAHQLFIVT
jgi:hypothetical protein